MKPSIYILTLLSVIFLSSCSKNDDPQGGSGDFVNDAKLELVSGANQSGYFGSKLNNDIIVKVSSADTAKRFLLAYEIVKGNGTLVPQQYWSSVNGMIQLNKGGEFKFEWSLGCNTANQEIKVTVYTDSIKSGYGNSYIYHKRPSAELIISASAGKPTGWSRACGCENFDPYFSKIVSFENKPLFLVNRSHGGLLFSEDGGINWQIPSNIPNHNDVSDMVFNSKGWAYITTKGHGVFYSKDMISWMAINNGFLDYRNPTAFYVDDEVLLTSFYFDGLYISTDNGNFWRKLLVGDSPNKFISRHPSGDLYFFDKWDRLYKSNDIGKSWIALNVNYQYANTPIADFTIDKNGMLYIGGDDATLAILDPTTLQGEVHKYYEWNGSSQHINNITVTDDDVLYVVNGHNQSGLYSKKSNWQLLDLGFSHRITNYYQISNNRYILMSREGFFYFSE